MRLSVLAWALIVSQIGLGHCLGQARTASRGAPTGSTSGTKAAPSSPGRWWALLVAVDGYDPATSGLNPLSYCYLDMAAARNEWLIAAGVPAEQIVVLHDDSDNPQLHPTKANIERELQAITTRLDPDDVLVVGAALHGVQVGQNSYICPVDTSLDVARTGAAPDSANLIALERVFDAVTACRAQFKLLIVDACRQTLPLAGAQPIPAVSGPQREFVVALNRMKDNSRGLAVLTSCSEGQSAYEDQVAEHGAFMHAFLKGVAGSADLFCGNNDGIVSLREAANYANRETKSWVYHKRRDLQEPDLLLGESTTNFPLRVLGAAPADGAEEDDLAFMARHGDTLLRLTSLGKAQEYDLAIDLLSHSVRNQPDDRENYARRGAAYRMKGEYALALADFEKAGTTLEMFMRYRNVPLQAGGAKTSPLPAGARVSITKIQGNWMWVTAVDNDPAKATQGWVLKKNVVWDPALADLALPLTPQRRRPDGAVAQRLMDIANGVAYRPLYVSSSLPGIPSRPGLPIPWIYVPDPRWYIWNRPAIWWPGYYVPSIPRPSDFIPRIGILGW